MNTLCIIIMFLKNILNRSALEAFMTCGHPSCHLSIHTKSSAWLFCLHCQCPWNTFLLFQLVFMSSSLLPFLIVRQRKIRYHPLTLFLSHLLSAIPMKSLAESGSLLQQWILSHFLSILCSSQDLSRHVYDVTFLGQESQVLFYAHMSPCFMGEPWFMT